MGGGWDEEQRIEGRNGRGEEMGIDQDLEGGLIRRKEGKRRGRRMIERERRGLEEDGRRDEEIEE